MKTTLLIIKLSFQIALTQINAWNLKKYEKSKYTPFMTAKLVVATEKNENGVVHNIEISNCRIQAVYDSSVSLLKEGTGIKTSISRNFTDMNDSVKYFIDVLRNKCF